MLKLFYFSDIKTIAKDPFVLPWGLSNSWASLDQSLQRKDYVLYCQVYFKCTFWLNSQVMAYVSKEWNVSFILHAEESQGGPTYD